MQAITFTQCIQQHTIEQRQARRQQEEDYAKKFKADKIEIFCDDCGCYFVKNNLHRIWICPGCGKVLESAVSL